MSVARVTEIKSSSPNSFEDVVAPTSDSNDCRRSTGRSGPTMQVKVGLDVGRLLRRN